MAVNTLLSRLDRRKINRGQHAEKAILDSGGIAFARWKVLLDEAQEPTVKLGRLPFRESSPVMVDRALEIRTELCRPHFRETPD